MFDHWSTNAWLDFYCRMIIVWLQECEAASYLDTEKPVYLVQMGVGSGQFGLALLHKLLKQDNHELLRSCRLCYVFADSCLTKLNRLIRHPRYVELKNQGLVTAIHGLVIENNHWSDTDLEGQILDFGQNPMAFISNDLLSQFDTMRIRWDGENLRTTSLAEQHSTCTSGPFIGALSTSTAATRTSSTTKSFANTIQWLKKVSTGNQSTASEFIEEFQAVSLDTLIDELSEEIQSPVREMIQTLIQENNAKTVTLPTSLLTLLMNVDAKMPVGSLQLFGEAGDQYADCSVTTVSSGIDWIMQLNAGYVFSTSSKCSGVTDQLKNIWMRLKKPGLNALNKSCITGIQQAFKQSFVNQSPQNMDIFIQSIEGKSQYLSDVQKAAFLANHNFEPRILAIFLPHMIEEGVLPEQRLAWRGRLDNVWNDYIPHNLQDTFVFQLGLLAMKIEHWSLAKICFQTLIELDGPGLACWQNLALVSQALGNQRLAEEYSDRALLCSPDNSQALQLNQVIRDYRLRCERLAWFDSTLCHKCEMKDGSQLILEPLAQHHLTAYLVQYRNPTIASSLRGPAITQPEQLYQRWKHWEREGDDNQRAHFAIVHEHLGFVGCVVFNLDSTQLAHLSFWIGCDYQQRGFGRAGVTLAVEHIKQLASTLSVSQIFTSVWSHNTPSKHILNRMGFEHVETQSNDQSTDEISYLLNINTP